MGPEISSTMSVICREVRKTFTASKPVGNAVMILIPDYSYRKYIEHLYHAFVYSPVSLLSGIYPLPAMHSLLVTLYVTVGVRILNTQIMETLELWTK